MKLIYPKKFVLIDNKNEGKKYVITSKTELKMWNHIKHNSNLFYGPGIIIFMSGKYMREYNGQDYTGV